MPADHPPSPAMLHWRTTLLSSTLFLLALVVIVTAMAATIGTTWLEGGYFFDHDAYLLVASGLAMIALLRLPLTGTPLPTLSHRQTIVLATIGGLLAYACSSLIFHHYAISRDEQAAEFAANYLAAGHLGWPIPPALRELGLAMMPMHTIVRPDSWTSSYLPVNSIVRACFALIGDQWLAGPALLVIGILALAAAGRRIWPDRPHAVTVAVIMAVSSTQILITAGSPFAMTGHFALNALWLACVLRGGRWGHTAALAISLAATGFHQTHFHITFILSFVLWLLIERRWRPAIGYTLACLSCWAVWRYGYPALLNAALGAPVAVQAIAAYDASSILHRIAQLQPGESLARFLAWQNILLMPLALTGAIAVRQAREGERVLIGCVIACLSGLVVLIQQDHGFGYRYLHPLLPCFCLLATKGWLTLEDRMERRLPATILAGSVAFAVLVTFPVAAWRTMVAAAPYEKAYAAARTADADYLLVDARAGAYLQDIIRFEPGATGPLILDLGYVPASVLTRICTSARVMVFGAVQARHFGVPADPYRVANDAETEDRTARLRRLHCGRSMPLA